ncbi:uncharacterized protein V6R79_003980 [Siganus canaliculatus]
MEPVWSKEVSSLPENIKVVDEADVVGAAGRGETGVEAKQTAEAAYSSAADCDCDVVRARMDNNPFHLRMGAQDVRYFSRHFSNSGSGERHRYRPPHVDVPHDGVPDDQGFGSVRSVLWEGSQLSHPSHPVTHTRTSGVIPL